MSWREAFSELVREVQKAGVDDAAREVRLIWEWATGRRYSDWLVRGGVIDPAAIATMRQAVARRGQHEPWAYIVGHREFFGLDLLVTPDVLIPRPETEHLVEAVLADRPADGQRVVDVGTGSGAIALALAFERPQWRVVGVDVSELALRVARRNAERLRLAVTFLRSDLLSQVADSVDVIAANLPYVARSDRTPMELTYEPEVALYADAQGLSLITRLVFESPRWLTDQGQIFLECGAGQAPEICRQLDSAGYSGVAVRKDWAGLDRVVSAVWRPCGGGPHV